MESLNGSSSSRKTNWSSIHCFHGHHQRPCHGRRSLGRLAQLVLYLLERISNFMYLKHFCDIKLRK
ncbi:unnamed protein product [Penicillium roqueforti FM164]|uniref:Genomic scaffold, ProqFM164S01 n=1 Tax=Penicillium roqueforti (strain FM164) TaxID=1365484 RepID=W6QJM8_PENRF|nr:unnamed protein product [Penicillium roqueforti FM164]